MTGFPKSQTELSDRLSEIKKRGGFSPALIKCLKNQVSYYTGPPHRKQEDWRYFPIGKVLNAGYEFSDTLIPSRVFKVQKPPVLKNADVLSIQNGQILKGFRKEGVKVFGWQDFLKGKADLTDGQKKSIMEALNEKRNSFCALNNLFSESGLILDIQESLENPLEIQFLQDSVTGYQGLFFRLFVFVRENCKAQIIETFYGSGADSDFSLAGDADNKGNSNKKTSHLKDKSDTSFLLQLQTDCFLGKKSQLDYIRLDQATDSDILFNQFFGSLKEDSEGRFLTLSLQAGLSRYETYLNQKKKSRSSLRGLSFLDGKRLAEHRVCVFHFEEDGKSHQLYQSLGFDSSRHIFNGLIHIAKGAQKTKAHQLSRALLLSERAFSLSCPELDVRADDVEAHHGASVSSLDDSRDLLFYLQSRGLSYSKALELVLTGTIHEILSVIGEDLRKSLLPVVLSRLKNCYTDVC